MFCGEEPAHNAVACRWHGQPVRERHADTNGLSVASMLTEMICGG